MSGKDYLKNMTYHRKVGNRIIKPKSPSPGEYWDGEMDKLYEDAFRWHINCLWNIMPSKNVKGLSCILNNLDLYGDMESWKHGTKILKKIQKLKTNIIHKEYKVYKEGEYPVTLQYSTFNEPTFFPLIKDEDIIRLHIIDLAINKCCAFVERTVERDYYDMIFIHNNIIPLWHLFWATSHRLQDFNPFSLADFFDKKLRFEKFNFSNLENSLIEYVSENDLKTSFSNIITDTKNDLDTVRKNIVLREHIGHIMLDDNNIIINPNSLPNKITCLDLQKETFIVENEPIDTKIMNDIKNNFPDNGYAM